MKIEWEQALTFEQYVITLFEQKLTRSDEFKALIRIYGRPKLEEIWKKYKCQLQAAQLCACELENEID